MPFVLTSAASAKILCRVCIGYELYSEAEPLTDVDDKIFGRGSGEYVSEFCTPGITQCPGIRDAYVQ